MCGKEPKQFVLNLNFVQIRKICKTQGCPCCLRLPRRFLFTLPICQASQPICRQASTFRMGQQTSRQLNAVGTSVGSLARSSVSSFTSSKRERHSKWLDNKLAELLRVQKCPTCQAHIQASTILPLCPLSHPSNFTGSSSEPRRDYQNLQPGPAEVWSAERGLSGLPQNIQ